MYECKFIDQNLQNDFALVDRKVSNFIEILDDVMIRLRENNLSFKTLWKYFYFIFLFVILKWSKKIKNYFYSSYPIQKI